MLRKLNKKLIAIVAATVVLVVAGLLIRQSYSGDHSGTKYMTVGGKKNPCQCTQRIEQ